MKEVRLKIRTTMRKQKETIEQSCLAKSSQKDDSWILIYKENVEGVGEVLTTIKVHNSQVTITRSGRIRMRQEYIMERWTEGKYESPYGFMLMKTKMERLLATEEQFVLHYRLKLNGEDQGRYEMQILMDDRAMEGSL